MNEEKTTLQKIMEQKAQQICEAIEQSISEGAKIVKCETYTTFLKSCFVDGVYVQKNTSDGIISVVLNFSSEKIASVFEPSKEDLAKLADQKRKELVEIEQQLSERGNE